jgi:acetyl esterase/lipase
MPNRAVYAFVMCMWALAASAAGRALPDFQVADRLNPRDPLPERETRWDNPSTTLTAVTYATLPGFRPLRLDLYRPAGATAAQPLVVFLHGGGWTHGNPRTGAAFEDFASILAALAQRGYAVASIEYRLSREAAYPAQSEDLAAALAFLRGNAVRLGIDPTKVALWGMSGGAYLAAMHATGCERKGCVQGFVGWFGVYDLSTYLRDKPDDGYVRALFRCESAPCTREVLDAASPVHRVSPGVPPALLLHGLADLSMRAQQSIEFAAGLRSAGNLAEVVLLPDVDHGFVGPDRATTQRALQRALTLTFDFFDRTLRPDAAR